MSGAWKYSINVHFPISISTIQHPPLANGLVLGYGYDKAGRLSKVDIGGTSRLSLAYDDAGRIRRCAPRWKMNELMQ